MAITRISQSTVKEGLEKFNSFIGGYTGVFGDFYNISTAIVDSGGAANIEFTSIPSSFTHLQLRGIVRDAATSGTFNNSSIRLNGVTTNSYAAHYISANGTSASYYASSSRSNINVVPYTASSIIASNIFGAFIIDILDYANSSKTTTVRAFLGGDSNDSGIVLMCSGLFNSTSPVTQITLPGNASFIENSTVALYGVSAP